VVGILTYIAIFGMTAIWVLGWMGLSVVIGSFFDLPLKTVALVGATLGPLGFIVVLAIGVLESRQSSVGSIPIGGAGFALSATDGDDPFA